MASTMRAWSAVTVRTSATVEIGTLSTAIMTVTCRPALGLDVAGQAVAEHDDLIGGCPYDAVAGLDLRMARGGRLRQDVGQGAAAAKGR
jgi:hypothetical protein